MEYVEITNNHTGETTSDAYDELIVNHGYDQENLLFRENNLGLNLENDFLLKQNRRG